MTSGWSCRWRHAGEGGCAAEGSALTGFPGTPQVARGALVGLDLASPLSSVVIFQYNPATIRRQLAPQGAAAGGARSEALRLSGPPVQTIEMEIELDAIDRRASGQRGTAAADIFGQLAALELMVYPKLAQVVSDAALAAAGMLWVVPPAAPLTVLVWGARRVLPVRVEAMSVTEQQFDPDLSPVRASVDVSLRVLTYDDLKPTNPGYALSLAHQAVLEATATAAALGSVAGVLGGAALPGGENR
jgi:hypothetical protein